MGEEVNWFTDSGFVICVMAGNAENFSHSCHRIHDFRPG
jgi:hypothetical protein